MTGRVYAGPAASRAERVERGRDLHRLGECPPDRRGRGGGHPRRDAAGRARGSAAFAHTSLQRRTIRTADLALAAADRDWIPVRRSWRLNGRHYGALQGRNKAQVRAEYGEQQFMEWRRSYAATPPPLAAALSALGRAILATRRCRPRPGPAGNPCREVSARLLPYWYDAIVPDLRDGGCVLVVSHGNTLRALVKHLDSIPDDQIAGLDIPTGIPLVYELGPDLRPDALGGQYLDPHAAREAIRDTPIDPAGRLARMDRASMIRRTHEQRNRAHRGRGGRLRRHPGPRCAGRSTRRS